MLADESLTSDMYPLRNQVQLNDVQAMGLAMLTRKKHEEVKDVKVVHRIESRCNRQGGRGWGELQLLSRKDMT